MASGWTVWVWLQCIGVVSGCCKEVVYRYPHNKLLLFPTPLVLPHFFGSSIPTSLFILKMFFRSYLCHFCAI